MMNKKELDVFYKLCGELAGFSTSELVSIGLELEMAFSTATAEYENQVVVNGVSQNVFSIVSYQGDADWHVFTKQSLHKNIAQGFIEHKDPRKALKAFNVSGVHCPEFVAYLQEKIA